MENPAPHRPTLRVLKILEAVSQSPGGLTLTELAELTGFAKSSLFPVVHTLSEQEFLRRHGDTSKYTLGMAMFETGERFLNQVDFLDEIREEMRNMVKVCGETCHFGVLSGSDVLYLHKEDSSETIRMVSSIGKRLPAYTTGLGKALLCDHGLSELKKLYPDGLMPVTSNTITDFSVLEHQLRQIRAEGVAYENEESNLMIQCVAVPLRKKGEIAAAISFAIPTFRASEESIAFMKGLLLRAKQRIERLLGNSNIDLQQL